MLSWFWLIDINEIYCRTHWCKSIIKERTLHIAINIVEPINWLLKPFCNKCSDSNFLHLLLFIQNKLSIARIWTLDPTVWVYEEDDIPMCHRASVYFIVLYNLKLFLIVLSGWEFLSKAKFLKSFQPPWLHVQRIW